MDTFCHRHDYGAALVLAIDLNRPHRCVSILTNLLQRKELETVLRNMSMQQLEILLQFIRDWNTTRKYGALSQSVLHCFFSCFIMDTVLQIKNIESLAQGLLPYTEKHLGRAKQATIDACLLKYTIESMKSVM